MTFNQSSADWANALGAVFCSLLFVVLLLAFYIVLFYRIFHRAGYNGWLGLLALIPGLGYIICLCILAFDNWPAQKKQAASGVRCLLPGYGEGMFIPDLPVAPAPAPVSVSVPAPPTPVPVAPAPPAPAAPVVPDHPEVPDISVVPDYPEVPDHPEVPDVSAVIPPVEEGQIQ
ncbi:MAG: hypothetical protein FWC54_03725 [Actinomycetia bacterium]|nr:hypothetical protein [Actinomycetes bacterium]